MVKGFVFKGKHSSQYGVIVNSVKRTLMPSLGVKSAKIPNRDGEYFFGTEKGMRLFEVTMTIASKDSSYIWSKIHELNQWLYSKEEEELIFDQEPNISYFAFIAGDTPLDPLYTHSSFTITFVCPDPYGYGPNEQTPVIGASPTNVTIAGREPTFPVIVANFTQPSTYFSVAIKTNHVHIGNSAGAGSVKVPNREKIIDDGMGSTSSWVANTVVESGTVSGAFSTEGTVFTPSYGTGSAWHGPSLKKMIATPIQDFTMEAHVRFQASQQKEMGRLEFYLLDVNGVIIGKISLTDAWSGNEMTKIEARAGRSSNGKVIMDYVGNLVKKQRKVSVKKKVAGKTTTVTETVTEGFTTYADFYGLVRINRKGNVWSAYITKINPTTGKHHTSVSRYWTDTKNLHMDKVAGVAIYGAQYTTTPAMASVRIHHLQLYKLNSVGAVEIPEIIESGDEITIDCETGAIFKNGERFLEDLDISSEFFSLNPGINQLSFEPDDKCDIQVFHRGRYM